MKDSCNRIIDYLRLSITDRCNLRCVYCMPESGIEFLPHEKILTYEEMLRLCRIMASSGLRKVKITGGEPLVRKDVAWLIAHLKEIEGIDSVTLTTNGVLLKEQIKDLVGAGLNAVNISLDTLDASQYQKLTRSNQLDLVLQGVEAALAYPDLSVKLNCVPMKAEGGGNQVLSLVQMAKNAPLHVRFIELMPIGLGKSMTGWTEAEIKNDIQAEYGAMTLSSQMLGNGPCVYYYLQGFQGKIGFISAISHKFCDQCNRIRLTSDGFLKTCLQFGSGIDLKAALEAGRNDCELSQMIQTAVWDKPKEHWFDHTERIDDGEQKKMFRIGG